MEFKHYIGVDVSKSTLDFAVSANGQIVSQYKCENHKKGITQTIKELRKLPGFKMTEAVFCMEFTGIYNNHLLDYLLAAKSSIWMEPALRIKQSQGMTRGKNDVIDAVRIAEYAYTFRNKIRLWTPVREELKKLRLLITMRDRLVNSIKELKVPIKENYEFTSKEFQKLESRMMKNSIAAMEKDLTLVEQQISELIKKDKQLNEMFKLMTSITGVGPVVAINILVVTDEFKKFENAKRFACYSGIAPFEHSSGSSVRGRMRVSHMANKKIKTLLHMAAMSAITAKGELREYYLRKVAQGKNKMSVINAVRNKIIQRVFSVIKRGTPYQKNYINSIA
jgi:transposase